MRACMMKFSKCQGIRKSEWPKMGIKWPFPFYGMAKRIAKMAIPNGQKMGIGNWKMEWAFFRCMIHCSDKNDSDRRVLYSDEKIQ